MARLVMFCVLGLLVCAEATHNHGGDRTVNEKYSSGAAEAVKGGKDGHDLSSGGTSNRDKEHHCHGNHGLNNGEGAGSDNSHTSSANYESAGKNDASNDKGHHHGINKHKGSDDRNTPHSGAHHKGAGSENEANVNDRDNPNKAHGGKGTYGNLGGSECHTNRANELNEDAKVAGRSSHQLHGGNQGSHGGISRGDDSGSKGGRSHRSTSTAEDKSSSRSESDEGTDAAAGKHNDHNKHGKGNTGKDAGKPASYEGDKKGGYIRNESLAKEKGARGGSGKGGQ